MDNVTEKVQPLSMEVNLRNMVKALFENSHASSEKGMLRWNLHNKVQSHPSCTVALVRKLVKQLQKCIDKLQMCESHVHVIPILHTLYYVVLQSPVVIPVKLYQSMYGCLMRLLILPLPHSAVALSTVKSIRTELFTPGSLYHRRVIAEQSLKNDHVNLQERVFLLADPELFSDPLEATMRADLEVSSSLRDPLVLKRKVVLRLLQLGLGSFCHSPTIQQALESLGEQSLEAIFQETVLAVEQGVQKGPEGWRDYIDHLQMIYTQVLTSCDKAIGYENNTVYPITMPYPEINFILWNDEEDLWNALTTFTLRSSFDIDDKSQRASVQSKNLKELNKGPPQIPQRSMSNLSKRRNAFKDTKPGNQLSLMDEKMESSSTISSSSREQRSHTARIVVMGDDRILGKLASAYCSIREKESKHIRLTKKINLQFYYIPVTDVEASVPLQPNTTEQARLSIASFLGKVDSWYDVNINILQSAMPRTAGMNTNHNKPSEQNLFFLDTLNYYLRCGIQKVNLPLYKVMMTRSNEVSSVIEEVFVSSLEADVAEFKHLKDKSAKSYNRRKRSVEVFGGVMSVSYTQVFVSKREQLKGVCPMACSAVITSEPSVTHGEGYLGVRFNSVNLEENTKIFTKTISIKAMENRTLVVCLDKDFRRTYSNIQRIEVSPYVDPGCNIRTRFSMSITKDLPLSKYVDKILSLPINTFSGVTS
ncbi:phosphoinositide 3-kinase regulatory subunit 6 isoform X2 [Boleophthalmus pectinirostris]|uniref:phosphoinositide 3-kinase regulatory subunit 6 isoform X2 n=1 Tax=Boleophthalmus pectinirostris TaxID=150288 RepID=UPI000A1C5625|nr:phosphoinositide 3-kinase regulatory subunit 6 isoform X2 [Boleophthalmus pectinirostris]